MKTLNAPGEDVTQCSNQCILCCHMDIHSSSFKIFLVNDRKCVLLFWRCWFLKMMFRFTNQCCYSNLGKKAEICQEKSPWFNSKVSNTYCTKWELFVNCATVLLWISFFFILAGITKLMKCRNLLSQRKRTSHKTI